MVHTAQALTAIRLSRRGQIAVLSLLLASWPVAALDAASADQLAAAILGQLGRSRGVTAIPGCGNGQLVRAFLAASGMKVHAMDTLEANLDATRQLVEPTGKIGLYCIIEKGVPSVMPFVNRFVDCIVITGVTDAALAGIPYAELERVLAPDGLAFVGRASSEGAGVTQAALQSWINAASKTRSTATVSTANGTWAVITGLELRGVDVWPMHRYDSRGSRYSKDSVAAFPWIPQAKMKPYGQSNAQQPGAGGTTVTSGGRIYEIAPDFGIEGPYGTLPPIMLRCYSVYNGVVLWERNCSADALPNLTGDPIKAYGRDVYLMRTTGGILQLNGITGEAVGTVSTVPEYPLSSLNRPTTNDQGCTPYNSSIYYNTNGTGTINWDFRINKARGAHFYKPPCGIVGTVFSNGMFIHMRGTCQCGSSRYWSSNIDGPAGAFQFDRDAAAGGSDRLEKGPAWGAVSQQVVPTAQDWPTHRANNSRSGASPVSVPASGVRLMWNWQPPVNYVTQVSTLQRKSQPDREPTPPAVAGAFVFIGGTDGFVRCINSSSGLEAWKYLTGGRIFATPSVANGCVYVGSADGYAYCLEAHTGRLVWRFRAAPASMRFNLYGYLSSVWPVLTGVLVEGNSAFFAAGMQSEYGTHVYCVDALTGALKWQNNKTASALNAQERLGVTPSGYMTIARNRLIVASSVPAMASFDLTTGALDSSLREWRTYMNSNCNYCYNLAVQGYPSSAQNRGREVGVVNNTFLIRGGKWIFSDNTFRLSSGYGQFECGFMSLDNNGMPLHPYCKVTNNMSVMSAWDTQSFFQMMRGDNSLSGYSWSAFNSAIAAHISNSSVYANAQFGANDESDYENGQSSQWLPAPLFTNTSLRFNAMALAGNAIVGTYTKTAVCPPAPETVAWYVGALNRTTGALLWEAQLPDVTAGIRGEPLHQGIAIDRNGNVIVTQYNGNVLCFGTGTTSVAERAPVKAVPAAVEQPAVSAAAWSASAAEGQNPDPAQRVRGTRQSAALDPVPVGARSAAAYALPAAPVLPAGYATWRDSSDMASNSLGALVHTLSPAERLARVAYEPRDMIWRPERECLPVVSVTASSSAPGTNAKATIDRKLTTRWMPAAGGTQSLTYDLGALQEVDGLTVVWYGARACLTTFAIELSADGVEFSQVDAGGLSGRRTHTMLRAFLPSPARYVRFSVNGADGSQSFYEIGVHGRAATQEQAMTP